MFLVDETDEITIERWVSIYCRFYPALLAGIKRFSIYERTF